MPTKQGITKNDTEALAGLYRLLRKVDSESALAYTAVEEVRAMAGENIISKIEAMQVENKAAQNTMMAALDALHATLGALKATQDTMMAALDALKTTVAENKIAIVRIDATLKAYETSNRT